MNEFYRITSQKYGSWLFTDTDKMIDFVNDVQKYVPDAYWQFDMLKKEEMSVWHHPWDFAPLERIDCTVDEFRKAWRIQDKTWEDFKNIILEQYETEG